MLYSITKKLPSHFFDFSPQAPTEKGTGPFESTLIFLAECAGWPELARDRSDRLQRNVTEVGEQDSFLAKKKHMSATSRADKFSHCLPRLTWVTWVTTLSQKVILPACATSNWDIDAWTGNPQKREQYRSFCLISFFPFLFQANCSLNFNFQLLEIPNSPNLSAACKMHYANEGCFMQRYDVHAQSL